MSQQARSDQPSGSRPRPGPGRPHGTMAEEAAKLADVVQMWLSTQSFGRPGGWSDTGNTDTVWAEATATPTGDQGAAQGVPPECQGCPYCTVRRAVGHATPEVLGHVADAVASLAAALHALDDSRTEPRP